MKYVSEKEFRQSLASSLDAVCDSGIPLAIIRQKGRTIVVMSEEEYGGLMETIHVLKSTAHTQRLLTAVAALEDCRERHDCA